MLNASFLIQCVFWQEHREERALTLSHRFTLFDSHLSHASSIRLCSGAKSFYIHMVEEHNDEHRRIITRNSLENVKSRTSWLEFCNQPWAFLSANANDEAPLDNTSDGEEHYTYVISDPTTGGKVAIDDAPVALARTVEIMNASRAQPLLFLVYQSTLQGSVRTCSLMLRGLLDIDIEVMASDISINPYYLAAFRACASLANNGLLPSSVSASPDAAEWRMSSTLPPLGGQKRKFARLLPSFWKTCHKSTRLYPMVFTFSNTPEPHAPFVLLTFQPLPDLPTFPLFFGINMADVTTSRGTPFEVDDSQYQVLVGFSSRVVRAVTNRPYSVDADIAMQFFAPLRPGWSSMVTTLPDIKKDIDWGLADRCAQSWGIPMRFGTAEQVAPDVDDAVIVDRFSEFTRRYIVKKIRSDMTPLSKPPGDFVGLSNVTAYHRADVSRSRMKVF